MAAIRSTILQVSCSWNVMDTRHRSILLSDDSSRALLQARFAFRRSVGAPATSPLATEGDADLSATAVPPPLKKKKALELETAFRCPVCKHDGSVECRIDLRRKAAPASCWACEARYAARADALTEAVDVYGEWVDECERARSSGRRWRWRRPGPRRRCHDGGCVIVLIPSALEFVAELAPDFFFFFLFLQTIRLQIGGTDTRVIM
ncbi:hypothetical protein ACP4OV_006698 [Aristida adscensionis]